ncbi:phage baseplate assembly protein V [Bartonella sp. CB60]|uniref:phage baseplate assembly protein V n=1 Tax=Bartonella sp. CB60 TaxID=3113619 RepID=UPI00300E34ED
MLEKTVAQITDLERRVSGQIVIGHISEVDYKSGRYRVQSGELLTTWLPDCQVRAGKTQSWSSRDVGEQVLLASPSGDLTQAVIIGAIPTTKTQAADQGHLHRTIYADGTKIDYDDDAHTLVVKLAKGGSFKLEIGDGAEIKAKDGMLKFYAPNGIEFQSNKNIAFKSGADLTLNANKATIEASKLTHNGQNIGSTHRHGGVQNGAGFTREPA